jgi:hypothetical protein
LLDNQASDVEALLILCEKFLNQFKSISESILLQVNDHEIALPIAQDSTSPVDGVFAIVGRNRGRDGGGGQLLQQLLCIANGQLAVRFCLGVVSESQLCCGEVVLARSDAFLVACNASKITLESSIIFFMSAAAMQA